jgi:hypothetical protein
VSGLRFEFQEMISELEAFSRLADPFLLAESRSVLPNLKQSLENYRTEPTGNSRTWQISTTSSLKTISGTRYEKGNRAGKHCIYAEITSIWEIRRIPGRNVRQPAKYFELIGQASTRVRLVCDPSNGDQHQEIAMWRMEIGDSNSPGCHFHVQVLGQTADFPFPKSLSVPRLPSLMMTPAATVEFVLAELFQDEWAKHIGRNGPHLNRWSAIQKSRWVSLLNWKLDIVQKSTNPWTAIKSAKPQPMLFA